MVLNSLHIFLSTTDFSITLGKTSLASLMRLLNTISYSTVLPLALLCSLHVMTELSPERIRDQGNVQGN